MKLFLLLVALSLTFGAAWWVLDRRDTSWFAREYANNQQRRDGIIATAHVKGSVTSADIAAVEESTLTSLERPNPAVHSVSLALCLVFSAASLFAFRGILYEKPETQRAHAA